MSVRTLEGLLFAKSGRQHLGADDPAVTQRVDRRDELRDGERAGAHRQAVPARVRQVVADHGGRVVGMDDRDLFGIERAK
jgi:hypothetical protein